MPEEKWCEPWKTWALSLLLENSGSLSFCHLPFLELKVTNREYVLVRDQFKIHVHLCYLDYWQLLAHLVSFSSLLAPVFCVCFISSTWVRRSLHISQIPAALQLLILGAGGETPSGISQFLHIQSDWPFLGWKRMCGISSHFWKVVSLFSMVDNLLSHLLLPSVPKTVLQKNCFL